jgi:hypothetical protein
MTEVEAKELNERLLRFVASQPDGTAFVDVIDSNVELVAEPQLMSFIVGNRRGSESVKLSNVRFNIRGALIAGAEIALSASIPDSLHAAAILCLSVVAFLHEATSVSLTDDEANLVVYLHLHGGYDGADKSILFAGIYQWLLERGEDPMARRAFERALHSLQELRVISCVGDSVVLKELVLLRK